MLRHDQIRGSRMQNLIPPVRHTRTKPPPLQSLSPLIRSYSRVIKNQKQTSTYTIAMKRDSEMNKTVAITLAVIAMILVVAYTTLNTSNQAKQQTASTVPEENIVAELQGTKTYDNLIPDKYYVLTNQGLKLYNGTSIYGIQDEMEYPGLPLGEITLPQNKTYTITINITTKGAKEQVFSLILVNTKANTTYQIPLASTKPTTTIINPAKTGGPATYKAYLYGYIKTNETKTSINYNIKIYDKT